ncbi:V-type ATP synthase subunit D [Halochromatium glycolicum]|nr:V-type ATP synthase subunit D [Halochromatium glycolicum]
MNDRELVPTQSAFLELKAERAGMQEGYRFLDEKRLILAAEILANLKTYEALLRDWRALEQRARASFRAAIGRHGLEGLTVYPPLQADCRLHCASRSVLGVRIEEPHETKREGSSRAEPEPSGPELSRPESSRPEPSRAGSNKAGPNGAQPQTAFDEADEESAESIAAGDAPTGKTDPAPAVFSSVFQSPEADACRAVFAELMPIATRLAVLTGNLERLRGEYLRTARRARALENLLLPELDAQLSLIENALEEQEREEAVRVRCIGRP